LAECQPAPPPSLTEGSCLAQIVPTTGIQVRSTRQVPWEAGNTTVKTWEDVNGNIISGIPASAVVLVAYKAVNDLSLWYYVEGYIDPATDQLVIIPDQDGPLGDNKGGNWVFQKNLISNLRDDNDPSRAYCGLALELQDGSFSVLDEKCQRPEPELIGLTEACQSLKWAELPNCYGGRLEGDSCTYDYNDYNREKAALYATTYAGKPDPNAVPDADPGNEISTMFCTYNYAGVHTGCAAPPKPIAPHDPDEFDCPERDDDGHCIYPTDCANFTSIAIWYGGLPMTERWFCEGIPCPTTGIDEYSNWTWAAAMGQPNFLKTILPTYVPEGSEVIKPFTPIHDADGNLETTKDQTVFYLDPYASPDSQLDPMSKIQQVWLANPDIYGEKDTDGHGIAKGDIAWAPNPDYVHMMIVVGWGPMLISWDEIDAFWEANRDPDDGSYDYYALTPKYPGPDDVFSYDPRPEYGYVPYLVDHGPQGAPEAGPGGVPVLRCPECVQPRPYYALYWYRQNDYGFLIVINLTQHDNAPKFFHIPDSLNVPVEEVKAPPLGLNRDMIPPQIP
jgi:hypothetical protein